MDFRNRKFSSPIVRLIKIFARTKGSYTFEVFAYEDKTIRQFDIRFLPNSEYYAINFMQSKTDLVPTDEEVEKVSTTISEVFFRLRKKWEGKKDIEEMTRNFLLLLIDNQSIVVPPNILTEIQNEIIRIFKNPDIVKLDVKGRPYFSNARFGKFFIADIGPVEKENLEQYQLSAN